MFQRLVKNEITKQLKKGGILIAAVLVLSLSVLIPFTLKYLENKEQAEVNLVETQYSLAIVEEYLAKTPTTVNEQIVYMIRKAEKDELLLTQELQLKIDDWRVELMRAYVVANATAELITAMIDGMTAEEVIDNAFNYNYDVISGLEGASIEELEASYQEQLIAVAECEKAIRENDSYKGIEIMINLLDSELQMVVDAMEELEQKPQDESVLSEIEIKKNRIASIEEEIGILQYRLDNQISFEPSDWRSVTLDSMRKSISGRYQLPMSESNFYLYGYYDIDTYEEYLSITNTNLETRKNAYAEWQHSLMIGEPVYDLYVDARVSAYTAMEVSVIATVLLIILMGCGIMSSEYSKGTIRMLVARPVKRQMIYTSKLSALLVIGFVLILLSGVLSVISSGIAFGFSSFAFGVTEAVGGVVGSQSYVMFLLTEIAAALGGMIFITALLVMLSTISRSTVLTLGVTMLLYLFSAPVGAIMISSAIIRYSFIPYLNLGMIRLVPDLSNNIWGMGYDLNLFWGPIFMVALATIISLVGCLVFVKKDIRN